MDGYTAHQVTGKVKAQKAEFYFQATFGGNPITLIVSGAINEDRSTMDGDLDVEPMALGGSFAGKRMPVPEGSAPPNAPPTGTSSPDDAAARPIATGTWKIDGDVQGMPVRLTCVLTEAEKKLTGTCTGEDKTPRNLTGTPTGAGVSWHFDTEYQDQPITVTMTATPTADATRMNGTIAVSPMDADGTFVAMKQ
jgi:hypothetical protein